MGLSLDLDPDDPFGGHRAPPFDSDSVRGVAGGPRPSPAARDALEQLALLSSKVLREGEAHDGHVVAARRAPAAHGALALGSDESHAAELEPLARLGPGRDLQVDPSRRRGDFDGRAEQRVPGRDLHVALHVGTVDPVGAVAGDVHGDEQVPGGRAPVPGLAEPGEAQGHAVAQVLRDREVDLARDAHTTDAAAGRGRRARRGTPRPRSSSRPPPPPQHDARASAPDRVGRGQGEPRGQVRAARAEARVPPGAPAKRAAQVLAEHRAEELREPAPAPERRLELLRAHRPRPFRRPELLPMLPVLAEPVVARPLLGIREDLVGLGHALELRLRVFAHPLRVPVRVPLQGQLAVGLLDAVRVGGPGDAEHFVVVLKFHGGGWERS